MTMNLMMISVKKVFISSNSRIICLPCPLPRGRFLIQESAIGGLSYYMKKSLPSKRISLCGYPVRLSHLMPLPFSILNFYHGIAPYSNTAAIAPMIGPMIGTTRPYPKFESPFPLIGSTACASLGPRSLAGLIA